MFSTFELNFYQREFPLKQECNFPSGRSFLANSISYIQTCSCQDQTEAFSMAKVKCFTPQLPISVKSNEKQQKDIYTVACGLTVSCLIN